MWSKKLGVSVRAVVALIAVLIACVYNIVTGGRPGFGGGLVPMRGLLVNVVMTMVGFVVAGSFGNSVMMTNLLANNTCSLKGGLGSLLEKSWAVGSGTGFVSVASSRGSGVGGVELDFSSVCGYVSGLYSGDESGSLTVAGLSSTRF